jgi:hypothetical protein
MVEKVDDTVQTYAAQLEVARSQKDEQRRLLAASPVIVMYANPR